MSDSTSSQDKDSPPGGQLRLESASGQYVLIPQAVAGQSKGGEGTDSIDLGNLLAILRRRMRLALAILATTVALGTALTLYQRKFSPLYQGGFTLLVSDPINLANTKQDTSSAFRDVALQTADIKVTKDLIDVLTSPYMLEPITLRLGISGGAVASGLTIKSRSGESSGVLDVSLRWDNPDEGQRILDKLSEEYLAFSLRERREKLSKGLGFLDEQAPALQQRVADLQQQLSKFRRSNSFLEPSTQGEEIQKQRQQLEVRRNELLRKKSELMALAKEVKSGNLTSQQFQGGQNAGTSLVTSSIDPASLSAFNQLQIELTSLEKQLAGAEATYQPSSPLVVSLRARISRLRPLVQQRQMQAIQASLSQVNGEEAEIQRQQTELTRQFSRNPILIKQYEALQQRLDVARDNLTAYLKAREGFRLEVAQRTVPWRVISPPSFGSTPVNPSLGRNLLLSLMLGAGAGMGAALLRDKLDNVFHSSRDVDQALDLPVLGRVPFLPLANGTTVSERIAALGVEAHYALRESLRNLYTSLRLMRGDKSLRMIALTSTVQDEGKSLVLTLLAQTLSELGQRVLMVDADLRAPTLHKYLGVENDSGLSSILTDVYSDTERFIQPVNDTLHLLTAGPTPPDAPRLLSSRRCAEVVNQIRTLPGYDLVLFDTPPALDLSDPLLLSDQLDGILFLVSVGRVDRVLTTEALKRIKSSSLDVLGLITNQVIPPIDAVASYGHRIRQKKPDNYGDGAEELDKSHGEAQSIKRNHWNNIPHGIHKLIHWLDGRS